MDGDGVIRIKVRVSTNMVGSECEDVLELYREDYMKADGSLDEEAVEEAARDWMFNHIEWSWEVES